MAMTPERMQQLLQGINGDNVDQFIAQAKEELRFVMGMKRVFQPITRSSRKHKVPAKKG